MNTTLKDKSVLFLDTSGQYTSMAIRLSKDFGTVYYCTNWQHSFPKYNSYCSGMNVPEIKRVDSPFSVLDAVDLIVFPDLFFGEFQDWLRKKGYIVFGSGSGENIEIKRDEFFELQEEVGLPVSGYKKIRGITKLRKHLKYEENKWIKTNYIRGNGETFNYINERLSESRLNEMQNTLGAFGEEAVFLVCDPIDNAIEIGHDTFVIDGKYPKDVMYGLELKDAAYITKVVKYDFMPSVLSNIDRKMSSFFKDNTYRGFFSSEVRWTGKKGYWGDATTRAGQPPSDLQQLLLDNFSEIIWNVAHGEVPEIKASKKYGCQLIIKSSLGYSQAVYFPEKYKDNIKIKNMMYKDGVPYHVVLDGIEMEEIGSVVATGNTLKEAIEEAKKIAATVEGDCIKVNSDALDEATMEILKFKNFGLPTI
mgnify:CR=1 FL=1